MDKKLSDQCRQIFLLSSAHDQLCHEAEDASLSITPRECCSNKFNHGYYEVEKYILTQSLCCLYIP